MAEGLDYSWSRPGSAAILAAGRSFVCRYLGAARFGGKGLSAAEMSDYLSHGIAVVFNFESSGQNTTSYANGVADATFAQGQAALLGYPDAVIYFSNDKQDTTGLVDYLHGVASVIGLKRTGLYGGIGAIQIAQGSNAASWYWQTYAWSGGRVAPGVHIYQYLNGQTINGASVDFDRSLQSNFGQIGGATPADVNVQPFPEDDMTPDQSAKLDWTATTLQSIVNMLTDPNTGVWKVGVPAIIATQSSAATGASISSDIRNWITDPNQGVLHEIGQIKAPDFTPDQLSALAAEVVKLIEVPTAAAIAKAVNDDAASRLAS